MSQIHLDILDNQQKEVFEKLRIYKKEAVLAGGTALSLQIAHRHSYDFDLFFGRKLAEEDIWKLKRVVKLKEVGMQTTEQINIITANNILINLVFYPFPSLFKKIKTFSLPLFSVKDIVLDKAFTIGRRAAWRDYVDLFFLLKKKNITLSWISKMASKKFGPEFNERLFLEQLVYFKDMEATKVSFIEESFVESDVKTFLINEVKKRKTNLFKK